MFISSGKTFSPGFIIMAFFFNKVSKKDNVVENCITTVLRGSERDKITLEPVLGSQVHLHGLSPVMLNTGSSLVIKLPKAASSQRVWTSQLCDLCLLGHVIRGRSGEAFGCAAPALLRLNFSDSSPASWHGRQEPTQAAGEFTFQTLDLHQVQLCKFTGQFCKGRVLTAPPTFKDSSFCHCLCLWMFCFRPTVTPASPIKRKDV